MSSTTNPTINPKTTHNILLEADEWLLTFNGKSALFEPMIFSPKALGRLDTVGFLDGVKMNFIYVDRDKERSVSYYESREKRYWRMPSDDGGSSLWDLRDFVSDHPEFPGEVKDAVWSRRPFRTFKDVATGDIVYLWEIYEDHLNRHQLLAFFKEHNVSVTAKAKGNYCQK